MDREKVFALKFQGLPVAEDDMFISLTAYSPTGMPKRLPATRENLQKYEKYLHSLRKYLQEGEERGYVLDTPRRLKYEKLFAKQEPTNDNSSFGQETDFTGNLQQ